MRAYGMKHPMAQCVLREENGSCALHYAASAKAADICRDLVLFWGAPLHQANKEGKTALHFARGDPETVLALEELMELMMEY